MSCNTFTDNLPILSYKIDASGNKNYYKISYDGFTNQFDESFSTKNTEGQIYIANFFFTRCPSICPPMRNELIAIAEEFSEENNFMIISHTIDPEHDSISVLKAYAEATGIHQNNWQFLRASEKKTKRQAELYMTNFKPNDDGSDFYHSSFVALVDQNQYIRGFYNVLVPEEVVRLKNDIQHILN
jgi:protein SCO1/2